MRIAFVTNEYVTEPIFDGGLANYIHRVCISLNQLGHEPIVIVSSEKHEKIMHENVQVYRINVSSRLINLFNKISIHRFHDSIQWLYWSYKLNKAVSFIHNEKPIDMIQHADYTATGLFRPKNIPSITRISYFLPLWRKANEKNITIDAKIKGKLELISLKKADALICPSKKIAGIIEKNTGKIVSILRSPIFTEKVKLDRRLYDDLLNGKKYLLYFGRIEPLKGAYTIANMINSLLNKYPELLFVFVGKNNIYRDKKMMDIIWDKASSLRGRVLYLGRLPHEQLYPIIQNAYAVVLPSMIDNIPNTCLEAMAFRRIVIGTKNTSMDELIVDGLNGFLSEVDNSYDLLNKIEEALQLDEKEYKKLSKNAYFESLKYSPQIVIPKLLKYYSNVIKSYS